MLYLHGKLFLPDTLFYYLFFSCDCSISSKMYSSEIFFEKCFRNVCFLQPSQNLRDGFETYKENVFPFCELLTGPENGDFFKLKLSFYQFFKSVLIRCKGQNKLKRSSKNKTLLFSVKIILRSRAHRRTTYLRISKRIGKEFFKWFVSADILFFCTLDVSFIRRIIVFPLTLMKIYRPYNGT